LKKKHFKNGGAHVQRLSAAAAEMEYGEKKGTFHIVIINDDLDRAYQQLRDFILPDIQALQAIKA
jgi:guanylate kinase